MRCIRHISSSVALLAVIATASAPANAAVGDARSYAAGNSALQIGTDTRVVRSIEGGMMRGNVALENVSGKKHISNVVTDPIRAQIGCEDFTPLLSAALADATKMQRSNGVIYQTDYEYKVIASREFHNALLTEIGIPALDGSSREAAYLSIMLHPEETRSVGGSGQRLPVSAAAAKTASRWLASAFKLDIQGMNGSRYVSRIEPITISRKITESGVGEQRISQPTAAEWEVSNIVLYVPQAQATDFLNWHDDFVINGNCGDDREKMMTLDLTDASRLPLMTVSFSNVGILSCAPVKADAGSDPVARVRVELYAEKASIAKGSGATSSGGGTAGGGGTDTGGGTAGGATPPADATGGPAGPTGGGGTAAAAPGETAAPAPAPTPVPAPGAPTTPVRRPPPTGIIVQPVPGAPTMKPSASAAPSVKPAAPAPTVSDAPTVAPQEPVAPASQPVVRKKRKPAA